MFCKNCGKRLDYQETVCPRCGKKVEEQEKSPEKTQEQVYPVSKKWFIISFLVLPCIFGIWCTTIGVYYYIALALSIVGIVASKKTEPTGSHLTKISKWLNNIFLGITLWILVIDFIMHIT